MRQGIRPIFQLSRCQFFIDVLIAYVVYCSRCCQVYETRNWQCLGTLHGHTDAVVSILHMIDVRCDDVASLAGHCITGASEYLASGSVDNTIIVRSIDRPGSTLLSSVVPATDSACEIGDTLSFCACAVLVGHKGAVWSMAHVCRESDVRDVLYHLCIFTLRCRVCLSTVARLLDIW